jgi:hypothetical protein
LRTHDVYDVIRRAQPLSELVSYRFPASQRRRYEQLPRHPHGFMAIGDAVCSFNPVYAQGMSVAALEALALRECLTSGTNQLPTRFYQRIAGIVESAWSVSAGGDLRFPEVEGERTSMVRFVNWYLGKLHIAAHTDPLVAAAFQKVVNMLTTPPTLMHPQVALRVLRGNVLRARGTVSSECKIAASSTIP